MNSSSWTCKASGGGSANQSMLNRALLKSLAKVGKAAGTSCHDYPWAFKQAQQCSKVPLRVQLIHSD